jgi:Ca-activated chloride channel family protein
MSFTDPIWLVALLLVPLALAAYAFAQRRARRYAVRFTGVATLRLAAEGTRAGWLRHVPPLLALLAIAALVVALAKPRTTYAQAVDEASIMLVLDHSGSMAADDVQPSRLAAAEAAANAFIDKLPATVKLGVVTFSTIPDSAQGPVLDHNAARAVVDNQQAGGSTATGNALQLALELLRATNPRHPPSAIVLLSDGAANAGVSPVTVARLAAREKIPIFTVALGTPNGTLNVGPFQPPVPVPPDPELMNQIAAASGGRTFDAQTADELGSIYRHLGSQLGSVTRLHEITPEFAIAGLVLLLGGVLVGVGVAGRLP